MRNALTATGLPPRSPNLMSVRIPGALAAMPRFSSPGVITAEVGSCLMVLQTSPKAEKRFAFCKLRVGYTFAEVMNRIFQREEKINIPDRHCREISSAPLELPPECSLPDPWW